MEPIQMEPEATLPTSVEGQQCTNCVKASVEETKNAEISMAFLLALVPVISLTFFGQIGLL